MEERAWMRERALETDSHHECIGSLSAVAVVAEGLCGTVVEETEEVGEGEWRLLTEGFRWKSIGSKVCCCCCCCSSEAPCFQGDDEANGSIVEAKTKVNPSFGLMPFFFQD